MKISEIMHSKVKSCSPESYLDAVALEMWNNDCGAIPIVDQQQKPIGIVTDRDIAMGSAIQHKPLWDIKSIDVAQNRTLHICKIDDDISDALESMKVNQIRRLPVVDKQGKLVGMLSMGDVISHTGNSGTLRKSEISEDKTLAALKAVSHRQTPHLPAVQPIAI